jgi:hypothetical protein
VIEKPRPSLAGPDGQPLYPRLEMRDQAITYTTRPGESFSADRRQILMAMARRQRDGASDQAIMAEFDIHPGMLGVTWGNFHRALTVGRRLLDEAIARGEVPAETMIPVLVGDEDDE